MREREILLVRHGESMGNLTGDYSTDQHDNLSPRGREQAERLAKRLESLSFDRILVSPLGRAKQTLRPYLERQGRRAEVLADLAECCWQAEAAPQPHEPALPYAPFPLAAEERGLFFPEAPEAPSPQENWADGLERMRRVRALIEDAPAAERRLLVVAHGYVLSILIHLLALEHPPRQGAEKLFVVENTHLCKLGRYAPGGPFQVEYLNRPPESAWL